jgi:hypothetical protein
MVIPHPHIEIFHQKCTCLQIISKMFTNVLVTIVILRICLLLTCPRFIKISYLNFAKRKRRKGYIRTEEITSLRIYRNITKGRRDQNRVHLVCQSMRLTHTMSSRRLLSKIGGLLVKA